MELKLIGAGYGRTGTNSTKIALNQLGYPCYHMFEVLENPNNKHHLDFWNKVANSPLGKKHDYTNVFENYTATIDFPAACKWQELFERNPNSKVLLTLHPKGPEAWYRSIVETIYFTENRWQFKVLERVVPFAKKLGNMCRKLIWKGMLKGSIENKQLAIKTYNDHIEYVKSIVPANKLLIFKVTDGWQPLCDFLGEPIPEGEFPNVNDRKEVEKTIRGITKGAYTIIAVSVLVLAAILYLFLRFA